MDQLYQSEAFPAVIATLCGALGAFVLLASGALKGPLPKVLQDDDEEDQDPAEAIAELKKALLGDRPSEVGTATGSSLEKKEDKEADKKKEQEEDTDQTKDKSEEEKDGSAPSGDQKKDKRDTQEDDHDDDNEMKQILERALPSSKKKLSPEQEAQIRKQVSRMPEDQRKALQAWLNDDGDHFWVHVGFVLLVGILFVGVFIMFSAYLIVVHEFNIYDPESWRNATISLEHTLRKNRILSPKGGWLLPEGFVIQERQMQAMQFDEL